ncbi:MAG: hypothetical protein Q8S26_18695 [Azonexus sp.]|nr:hypothetical protein [Azonexus sp.]
MGELADEAKRGSGLALAGVQFFFTLGWTVYVLYLPGLLSAAGIAASWLPLLLMLDQLIFAVMDIAFGVIADRLSEGYRRLARLLLVLTTLSAVAFLLLPMAAGLSSAALLALLLLWVVTASVVRAPTLVLLAKAARREQQAGLVLWYAGGMALAAALSPFLGLWLKGVDVRLPFALSALTLLVAVLVLLRVSDLRGVPVEEPAQRPISFVAYLPLLLVLTLAVLGFQIHASVNASSLYLAHATREMLPWLMPLLWLGFFAVLPVAGKFFERVGTLPGATAGILLTAIASYATTAVDSLEMLILFQVLAGAGWALAFAGLMENASAAGSRGAEGVFMGSFFAVTALGTFFRIGFASQLLPAWQSVQFALPAALLLAAGLIAAVYALKTPKSPSAPGRE